ncbi:hypothetical protein BT96DRAFT_912768 [Gymnopus androsaceus JB14]|uniref:Amidohydrolase-related domain-containing protein n=1 Tax=Gymnopus androsaceus JB14 TaxID=1447944 RepID=A0A6A4IPX1_9AGAR|nr:hypothetical protein BT96DRAFT_912768 [Gymnopus androsaceus JB14]
MTKGFIDIHHHFFPSTLNKARINEDVGWQTPEGHLPWTPELSLKFMDQAGIDTAILSFPALSAGSVSEENRALARERNTYMAKVCQDYPGRFDVEGALAEIAYAMDVLKSDGKYVGDKLYEPIWTELDSRQVTVFLHGTQTPSSTPHPDQMLGIPVVEVPNETFKAAAHLVVTTTKRKHPDVKIILSHLGGSTPFLSARVAALSNYMGCPLTPEEIISDFKTFYFDTALGAHEITLSCNANVCHYPTACFSGRTFQVNSDFMYFTARVFILHFDAAVSTDTANWYTKNLEDFYAEQTDVLKDITSRNALSLFPQGAATKIKKKLTQYNCIIGISF